MANWLWRKPARYRSSCKSELRSGDWRHMFELKRSPRTRWMLQLLCQRLHRSSNEQVRWNKSFPTATSALFSDAISCSLHMHAFLLWDSVKKTGNDFMIFLILYLSSAQRNVALIHPLVEAVTQDANLAATRSN